MGSSNCGVKFKAIGKSWGEAEPNLRLTLIDARLNGIYISYGTMFEFDSCFGIYFRGF